MRPTRPSTDPPPDDGPTAGISLPGSARRGEDAGLLDGARPTIGKYELLSLIGEGGMGVVYRAFDPVLEREVAVKVMLPEVARDPEKKSRFEREARAVARLTHPYIVTLFDLGYHTDGSPYIVMELLKGHDLQTALAAQGLTIARRLEVVLQVLDGLGHAHRVGIVHRDIKPANVFLVEDGTPRIMDFGIARFASAELTGCGEVLGTPSYMAPEQVLGQRVDGRADLFSVGALLAELLTGRRPFEAQTPVATLYRVVNQEPEIELPAGDARAVFLPVLRRALAKRPDERYPDAAQFASALRRCLGEGELVTAVTAPLAAAASFVGTTPGAGQHDTARMDPRLTADTAPADPSGIFELLRAVHVGRKSGHLHFAVGGERKTLRILRGQIVLGSSDAEGEHLGDVLVRYGFLGQHDRERAVRVVLRERKPLGAVLTGLAMIDRERLEQGIGLHVREILFSVIDQPRVTYAFEEVDEGSLETELRCPLSTSEVILEATRRVQNPEFIRRALGDMSRVLALAPDPLLTSKNLPLTPTDGFVLSRVDGTLSATEIVSLIPLPQEDTERSLFGLLCTGAVGYLGGENVRRTGPQGRQATGGQGRERSSA